MFFSGTVDDTELVEGLVLEQKISHLAGGISQVEKAKIGLIQFCISPPKTDVSLNGLITMCVIVSKIHKSVSNLVKDKQFFKHGGALILLIG